VLKLSGDLERALDQIEYLEDRVKEVENSRDKYLRYAVEISAQLQFIVSGSVRALQVAANVQRAVGMDASKVPSSDMAELAEILSRLPQRDPVTGAPVDNKSTVAVTATDAAAKAVVDAAARHHGDTAAVNGVGEGVAAYLHESGILHTTPPPAMPSPV
jgi:hypothetical protein